MSIRRIYLRDFVIVSSLELQWDVGFSALTGETGAGKSMVIDALQLALGQRADNSCILEGAAQTEISIAFDIPTEAKPWLEQAGIDLSDGDILIRRIVDRSGKSRSWINGSAATLTQLRELGAFLVDIHGQHAWANLSSPVQMLNLLDNYAQIHTETVHAQFRAWREAQKILESAQTMHRNARDESERLSWQCAEVDKLNPQIGEWETLSQEHGQHSHAQDIMASSAQALHLIEGGGAERGSAGLAEKPALLQLHEAEVQLTKIAHLHAPLREIAAQLQSAQVIVQDAAHALRSNTRHGALDEGRLAQIDERMGSWLSLARRYRCKPEELAALSKNWHEQLAKLNENLDLAQLEQAVSQARAQYDQSAAQLHTQRAAATPNLAREVTEMMQELGMAGGSFAIDIQNTAASSSGRDAVDFLIAGHAGASPRPLAKTASGGELSRLALALAVVISRREGAPTLIFDEIDAGIGGAVAHTVGRLMRKLGASKQVIAVTHLAQVAAPAHHHFRVEKTQTNGASSSQIQLLHPAMRVEEVARMLGGGAQSASSLAHAQEMLEQSA